jgi:transcriptional regulator with XRE-family HTH domain
MEPNLQDMVQTLLAAGLTQKAIADRIPCSQPTISDIASGKVGKARPSYRLVSGLERLIRELPKRNAKKKQTVTA